MNRLGMELKNGKLFVVLFIFFMICLLPTVVAHAAVSGDWTYTDNGDGTATIDKYIFEFDGGALHDVTIPSTIAGLTVTAIGDEAFFDRYDIKNVVIPDSVTSIGESAFRLCTHIENIDMPENLTSIGDYAFFWCFFLESIIIPEGTLSIGNYAFYGDYNLYSVWLQYGLVSIGEGAFQGCYDIITITIPQTVTTIGAEAFLDVGDGFRISGYDNTFAETYAGINGITFVSLGPAPYRDANGTTWYYEVVNGSEARISRMSLGIAGKVHREFDLHIPSQVYGYTVTEIDDNFLYTYSEFVPYELRSVTVPDTVKKIGNNCFNIGYLETINLGNSVEIIGYHCFDSPGLKTIDLPASVQNIYEKYVFGENMGTDSTDPRTLSFIGEDIEEINVDGNNSVYSSENGVLYNKDKTELLRYPEAKKDSVYTTPDTLILLGDASLYSNRYIRSMVISDNVQSIGKGVGFNCASLNSLTIGTGVTTIKASAFEYTLNLKSVYIPDNVTEIEHYAFWNYTSPFSDTAVKRKIICISGSAAHIYALSDSTHFYVETIVKPLPDKVSVNIEDVGERQSGESVNMDLVIGDLTDTHGDVEYRLMYSLNDQRSWGIAQDWNDYDKEDTANGISWMFPITSKDKEYGLRVEARAKGSPIVRYSNSNNIMVYGGDAPCIGHPGQRGRHHRGPGRARRRYYAYSNGDESGRLRRNPDLSVGIPHGGQHQVGVYRKSLQRRQYHPVCAEDRRHLLL